MHEEETQLINRHRVKFAAMRHVCTVFEGSEEMDNQCYRGDGASDVF